MINLIKRLTTFALLFFFFIIFPAKSYGDWQLVGYVEDQNSFILNAFFIKADSISVSENQTISAWTQSHIRVPIKLDKKSIIDIVALYEFNCREQTFRTTETVFFYTDGTQEKIIPEKKWEATKRAATRMLFDFVCK